MDRYFFSLRVAALVVLAAIVAGSVDLAWRGFVVVHDPQGRLSGAAIPGADGGVRVLRLFAPGYRAGRPGAAGRITLVCRTGTRVQRGDVMPGERTAYTVDADDCLPGTLARPHRRS